MQYSMAIRSVLRDSPSALTPQEIRDTIKQRYPELYDNVVARHNVALNHYNSLDHALLSRIYTATKNSKQYVRDESSSPFRISLIENKQQSASINKFFSATLKLPVSNPRWSWGVYNADKDFLVLRLWEDNRIVQDGREVVMVYKPRLGSSNTGDTERKRHVEALLRGATGYAVMCEAVDQNTDAREIASFDDQILEKLGPIHTDSKGCMWAEVNGSISVDDFLREVTLLPIPKRASELLVDGDLYSREELAHLLRTSDATIKNGIFRPAGYSSVLLFVTERKSKDRTPYADLLEGDVLHMQGQNMGRTDSLLADHRERGLELLAFYRASRNQHPKAAFRYEGRFAFQSKEGEKPANFVLQRDLHDLALLSSALATQGEFDPTNESDARNRTLASIVRRRGQNKFRQRLLEAYGRQCAVSGCDVEDVLEAAHIMPYRGDHTNHVTNGLLLRADLHTLFDLGLVTVDPLTLEVWVKPTLRGGEYGRFHGRSLRQPKVAANFPSREALRNHFDGVAKVIIMNSK